MTPAIGGGDSDGCDSGSHDGDSYDSYDIDGYDSDGCDRQGGLRIAVVSHVGGTTGGIEWVVRHQVEGLRGRGHAVTLHCPPPVPGGRAGRAVAAGALALGPAGRLRPADAVLAHYAPAPWIAARAGVPFVYYVHHPLRIVHPTGVRRRSRRHRLLRHPAAPLGRLEDRAVSSAAALVAVAPAVAREMAALYARPVDVVPPGIDTEVFSPSPRAPAADGDGDGDGDGGSLLFVGRLDEPYKHLDWAAAVAARLRRPLRVVGAGRPGAALAGDDHLVWLGPLAREALVAEYRRAALLLFPSEGEDFGLAPLEALATGCPVVAWDDGAGPSWTLGPLGEHALAEPYDLDALTARAAALLQDRGLREDMARAGRRLVWTRFSWDAHLDALVPHLAAAAGRDATRQSPDRSSRLPGPDHRSPRATGRLYEVTGGPAPLTVPTPSP